MSFEKFPKEKRKNFWRKEIFEKFTKTKKFFENFSKERKILE